jgi:hypothetical protein
MRSALATTAAAAAAVVGLAGPAHADDEAGLTITDDALTTLTDGELSVQPTAGAAPVGPASFAFPVTSVSTRPSGAVKAIRLSGGLTISGEATMVLTNFRVNLKSQQASVRASSPATRIRAFDVVKVKVNSKRVRGVLIIAPGTASVLNRQFDTYVFSDGLRFARFVYPR